MRVIAVIVCCMVGWGVWAATASSPRVVSAPRVIAPTPVSAAANAQSMNPPEGTHIVHRLSPATLKKMRHIARSLPGDVSLYATTNDGQPLFRYHQSKRLPLASVTKIVTAAAQIHLRGEQSFTTSLQSNGHQIGSVWHGDITLTGGGDPSLHPSGIRSLARQLHQRGITSIDGTIVGDESLFDTKRGVGYSDWKPSDETGMLSALSVNEGYHRDGGLVQYPVSNAVNIFIRACDHYRIAINGGQIENIGGRIIAQHRSAPSSTLLQHMLRISDNVYAEMFLKQLGSGTHRSTRSGARRERQWLQSQGATFIPHDGSGLSRSNKWDARSLVTFMRSKPVVSVRKLLPRQGIGTLESRSMTGRAKWCRAKTGTLAKTSNLAGYCRGVTFAWLMDQTSIDAAHKAQDQLTSLLANASMQTTLEAYQPSS